MKQNKEASPQYFDRDCFVWFLKVQSLKPDSLGLLQLYFFLNMQLWASYLSEP